jgi:hypothetical protein
MHDPLKSDGYDRVRAHTSKKTAREHEQEKEANLDRARSLASLASAWASSSTNGTSTGPS